MVILKGLPGIQAGLFTFYVVQKLGILIVGSNNAWFSRYFLKGNYSRNHSTKPSNTARKSRAQPIRDMLLDARLSGLGGVAL